jgi:hypothetical protein
VRHGQTRQQHLGALQHLSLASPISGAAGAALVNLRLAVTGCSSALPDSRRSSVLRPQAAAQQRWLAGLAVPGLHHRTETWHGAAASELWCSWHCRAGFSPPCAMHSSSSAVRFCSRHGSLAVPGAGSMHTCYVTSTCTATNIMELLQLSTPTSSCLVEPPYLKAIIMHI